MPVRAKQCTRDGKELPEPKGPCFKVFGGESIPLQQSTEGQAGFKRCSKLDDLLESLFFFFWRDIKPALGRRGRGGKQSVKICFWCFLVT